MAPAGEELVFLLVVFGAVLGLMFLASLWMALRSRRPPARKPPRRTFEHGRRLGRAHRAQDTDEALRALRSASIGRIEHVHAEPSRVEVIVRRKRGQPCVQAAGYLAGLFESAWAHEVLVSHPACGGEGAGDCAYVVQRAPIGSGAPTAAASTPGSGGEPRRSPRARHGGA